MNYSLYIHIPFCKHRCHYCDFNTYAGRESLIPDYINALINELRIVSNFLPELLLHSVYFGGGTPSLISLLDYQKLFKVLKAEYSIANDCEISLEANPGTVSLQYMSGLHDMGFNRISFGVQSTNSFDLPRLDRSHNIEDVLISLRYARQAGFENINLDMIFGLPWQNLSSWKNSLSRAVNLAPEHFSLYSLIIEAETLFNKWYQKGLFAPKNEDLEADMFEYAIESLKDAGYIHYEISNWARSDQDQDFQCRHNMQYWLNQPYIGIGAGAHGYLGNIRTENKSEIEPYIGSFTESIAIKDHLPETPATLNAIVVDRETQMRDFMWLGLRLVHEGVSMERFQRTYGCSAQDIFMNEIDELLILELVEWCGVGRSNLRLTQKGVLLANQVFMRFI